MKRFPHAITASILLTACGGGGSVVLDPEPGPANPPENEPTQQRQSETHRSAFLSETDFFDAEWLARPTFAFLPQDGTDGLHVDRESQGDFSLENLELSPALIDRLQSNPAFYSGDRRITEALINVVVLTYAAYWQWTRHLDDVPEAPLIQIGGDEIRNCGHHSNALACYNGSVNAVIVLDEWFEKVFFDLASGNDATRESAFQEFFSVMTHEAGHQFRYRHPYGRRPADCSPGDRCTPVRGEGGADHAHAPYGSGSVMAYDDQIGGRSNYHVTPEDISRIPDAAWNDDARTVDAVYRSGAPSSIDNWGVWITAELEVSGQTAPGRLFGGNLSIAVEHAGRGWVHGKPSENVSLPATATWSGEDSFLGVDMDPNYLGALLRADANLRYTFGNRPNLNLRVNDFEAHYATAIDGVATWHDHNFEDWGDFRYNMDCTSGGCSGDSVEAKWYSSDSGDPSGWVGGVVNDQDADYVGSFVAAKD